MQWREITTFTLKSVRRRKTFTNTPPPALLNNHFTTILYSRGVQLVAPGQ